MPQRDAPPMPPKNASGTDTTSAHGHEMTSSVRALYTQKAHCPVMMDGTTASSAAPITTAGVYQRANLRIKLSLLALFPAEFSTSSRIFATVDSA